MPVISNTSPILNLAIVDHLFLLKQQFGEVLIPSEVIAELKLGTDYPGVEPVQDALRAQWLQVIELTNQKLAHALRLELDQGEAAAIALALDLDHKQILLDERDGRAKAKALGLQPIGILGVLLRAKFEGKIPSVETVMQRLRQDAGFFISANLYNAVLTEAGER